MSERLVDSYDAVYFDLDGVIYLGDHAVEGAVEAIASLRALGKPVMFVTNNAARSAQTVVDHLLRLGFEATLDDVLTSAQVAVRFIAKDLPAGARVLVSGSQNLVDLIAGEGFVPVHSADDQPVAVVQGYDPQMTWPRLDEAALAIQRGARWYATNNDGSRPTDRGLVPGAGGAIAAVAAAVGGEPTVFGKPYLPMLAEAARRTGAKRPLFVGDRIDTDIAGAANAGMDSLMVFTGAHGKADLVAAGPGERPTHVGPDLSALLQPARAVQHTPGRARCGAQVVEVTGQSLRLDRRPRSQPEQFDALMAIAWLAWANPGVRADGVLDELDQVR